MDGGQIKKKERRVLIGTMTKAFPVLDRELE
jgi:hypothetical protein